MEPRYFKIRCLGLRKNPCVRGAALRQQPLGFPDNGQTGLHGDCQRASAEQMVKIHHTLNTGGRSVL